MIRSPAGFDGGDRIKRYLDYYQPSYGVMMLSAGASFSPASLFAAGEQGAWYDPSDLTTLFQDAAGTIPVTAVGQPVGRINDKSGRGNHATQSTPGARPILRQDANSRWYLEFDGTDDSLSTGTINPGSVDKAQVFAGARKVSDALQGMLLEFSPSVVANNGSFYLLAPATNGATNYQLASKGTTSRVATAASYTAPITNVLTGLNDISGDNLIFRVNGSQAAQATGDQGTGNFLSYPLFIGSRAGTSIRFNGWLYSLILRFSSANLDAATISQAETWVNGKTGAY